jgi:hypothetical protein
MSAMIADELKTYLQAAAQERQVADVRIGLGYTAVMLDDGSVAVLDGPGILQVVSEGGGMGFFGKRVRKVNVRPAVAQSATITHAATHKKGLLDKILRPQVWMGSDAQ